MTEPQATVRRYVSFSHQYSPMQPSPVQPIISNCALRSIPHQLGCPSTTWYLDIAQSVPLKKRHCCVLCCLHKKTEPGHNSITPGDLYRNKTPRSTSKGWHNNSTTSLSERQNSLVPLTSPPPVRLKVAKTKRIAMTSFDGDCWLRFFFFPVFGLSLTV